MKRDINKKDKISPDVFSYEKTSLQSREEAVEIAKKYPVCVEIKRECNREGVYVREIEIKTYIWWKDRGKNETKYSEITQYMIEHTPEQFDYTVRKAFKDFDEAEKWVREKIDQIAKKENGDNSKEEY